MPSQVVKPENLGSEFDTSEAIEVGKIRLKLGAGLSRQADGTIVTTAAAPIEKDIFHLGGQFLLDPNERNTFGILGVIDPTNTQDVGNSSATTIAYTAGGISYPWDTKLTRFRAWYRVNNVDSEAFGFFIAHTQKVENSTANQPFTALLDEVADNGGVGPREPTNTRMYLVDIPLTGATIPAHETITFGVDSPTAIATNRYVQIADGYLLFERV